VFNLAATRPDLLTGVDPATGKPAPYGAVGVHRLRRDRVHRQGPTANLADPVANSQVPPRWRTTRSHDGGSARFGPPSGGERNARAPGVTVGQSNARRSP